MQISQLTWKYNIFLTQTTTNCPEKLSNITLTGIFRLHSGFRFRNSCLHVLATNTDKQQQSKLVGYSVSQTWLARHSYDS